MKDPRIINEFTLDRALFDEAMRLVIHENYARPVMRLMAGLAVLWLALAAYTAVRGGTLLYALIELVILILAALWALWYIPERKLRRARKTREEKTGEESSQRTEAGKEYLESTSAGRVTRVRVTDICQTLHSPHFLILIDGQRKGILLKHDAFLLGSEEEILEILKNGRSKADGSPAAE